ncbi:SDR family oxidoreductase [Patescibacteria group bacterium]|nr:SDR family oxidoreductase [Patescibacteria group bacterium]
MKLKDKRVLITGGSSGLGLALAKQLIAKHCQVHICARHKSQLKKATAWQCDVADYKQVEAMIKKIGPVDILINNAGLWLEGDPETNQPAAISQTLDVNLKGMIFATRAVLPSLKKLNQGFIINVISTSGLIARPESMIYAASKWGAAGFSESLKENLKQTNIKVCSFYPGGMNTNLFKKLDPDKKIKHWMDPVQVAEIVIFILEHEADNMTIDSLVVKRRG